MLLNLDTERMTREESLAAARLLLEMAKSPRVFAGAAEPDEDFNKFADDLLAQIAGAFGLPKPILRGTIGAVKTTVTETEEEPGRVEPPVETEEEPGRVEPPETTDGVEPVQPPDDVKPVAPPTDVELADGLPWDSRIHGGGKTKLASAPHGWKLKRRPQKEFPTVEAWDAYVAKVEAELRALMAVPNPNHNDLGGINGGEATAAETFAQTETVTPVAPPKTETVVDPPQTPGAITTFPALLSAITAHGKSTVEVTAACNQVDVPALPLLGGRPDLIPAVAAILFPVEP